MYLLCNSLFCFTIASNRTASSPTGESEDFDVLEYLENFTTAYTRTPPPIKGSEDLDILRDLEILPLQILEPSLRDSEDLML